MKHWIKILLLLLAIFPMWLTIVAMGETVQAPTESLSEQWRQKINSQLLKLEDRKIQIVSILPTENLPNVSLLNREPVLDMAKLNGRSQSTLGLKFLDDEGRLIELIQIPVRALIQERVAKATRDLERNDVIRAADVELAWMEVSASMKPVRSLEDLIGAQTLSRIPIGSLIQRTQLRSKAVVQKGDRVTIRVLAPGLKISGFGIAQENGGLGQTIRILNSESKREVYGKVTGESEAEVRL